MGKIQIEEPSGYGIDYDSDSDPDEIDSQTLHSTWTNRVSELHVGRKKSYTKSTFYFPFLKTKK